MCDGCIIVTEPERIAPFIYHLFRFTECKYIVLVHELFVAPSVCVTKDTTVPPYRVHPLLRKKIATRWPPSVARSAETAREARCVTLKLARR